MALTKRQILLMVGMMVTGAINTLFKSFQLQIKAVGLNDTTGSGGTPHLFKKPWLQTLIMFMGEIACLLGYLVVHLKRRRKMKEYSRLYPGEENVDPNQKPLWTYFVFCIPACCDILGTGLAGIGLLYISASVWQMMRGSLIIFTGILSMIFLKRRLRLFHWTGISLTVIGLTLTGISSVLSEKTGVQKSDKAYIGILFVLLGCMSTASQMIVEEKFLKHRGFHPLQVVGMEGSFGTLITAFIVLPIMQHIHGSDVGNVYENTMDSLYMLYNSPTLLAFSFVYMFSIAFYNYFGLAISKSLSSVHRTLIDSLRVVAVWVIDIFIHYIVDDTIGEPFSKSYGLIQIDGFLFLIIGTMIYNQVMPLDFIPICQYEEEATVQDLGAQIPVSTSTSTVAINSGIENPNYNQDNDIDERDSDTEIPSIMSRNNRTGPV